MRFLVDTNLWLEVLLNQQRAQEVRLFFRAARRFRSRTQPG